MNTDRVILPKASDYGILMPQKYTNGFESGKVLGKNYFEQIFESTPEAILILDENDKVIDYNNGFKKMFLINGTEIIGKHKEEIITPNNLLRESKEILNEIHQGKPVQKETIRLKRDGRPLNVLITGSKIKINKDKCGSYLIYIDISKHKRSEEQMRSSIVEKEVLIREVHHRVKNNLQMINSLLHLQAKKLNDKSYESFVTDFQNKINSIALIHEKLYQASNFTRVDFGAYTKKLTHDLFRIFEVNHSRISLNLKTDNVFFPIDIAIPCGMIINELVTNSLKHAFPGDSNGEILIEINYQYDNKFTIIIRDNGKGLPGDFDLRSSKSLGFCLVQNLVKQLEGKLEINRKEGTEFKITFSILN